MLGGLTMLQTEPDTCGGSALPVGFFASRVQAPSSNVATCGHHANTLKKNSVDHDLATAPRIFVSPRRNTGVVCVIVVLPRTTRASVFSRTSMQLRGAAVPSGGIPTGRTGPVVGRSTATEPTSQSGRQVDAERTCEQTRFNVWKGESSPYGY